MYPSLKELIYPNKCIICRDILENNVIGHLCDKCYSFVLRHHLCSRCGRPYNIGDTFCVYCNQEESDIERVISLFPYDEKFKKAVLRWKYQGIRKYAKGYADLFANDLCVIDSLKIEALIPVPLSPFRARMRGFNQAEDLANEISKLTGIKVYDVLRRVKDTKPQSKCTKKERLSNIKGSIAVKADISSLDINNIAIIDDIYTTGATVKECIHAMNRQNLLIDKKIYVLTVCVGI
jgi:ComF family protein